MYTRERANLLDIHCVTSLIKVCITQTVFCQIPCLLNVCTTRPWTPFAHPAKREFNIVVYYSIGLPVSQYPFGGYIPGPKTNGKTVRTAAAGRFCGGLRPRASGFSQRPGSRQLPTVGTGYGLINRQGGGINTCPAALL